MHALSCSCVSHTRTVNSFFCADSVLFGGLVRNTKLHETCLTVHSRHKTCSKITSKHTHTCTHANRAGTCCQILHCAFNVFDLPAPSSAPSPPAAFSPTAKFHRFIAVVCSCSAAVRCSRLSKSSDGTLLTRLSARSANSGELSPPWSAVSSLSKAAVQGGWRKATYMSRTYNRRVVAYRQRVCFKHPVVRLYTTHARARTRQRPPVVILVRFK